MVNRAAQDHMQHMHDLAHSRCGGLWGCNRLAMRLVVSVLSDEAAGAAMMAVTQWDYVSGHAVV